MQYNQGSDILLTLSQSVKKQVTGLIHTQRRGRFPEGNKEVSATVHFLTPTIQHLCHILSSILFFFFNYCNNINLLYNNKVNISLGYLPIIVSMKHMEFVLITTSPHSPKSHHLNQVQLRMKHLSVIHYVLLPEAQFLSICETKERNYLSLKHPNISCETGTGQHPQIFQFKEQGNGTSKLVHGSFEAHFGKCQSLLIRF